MAEFLLFVLILVAAFLGMVLLWRHLDEDEDEVGDDRDAA